MRDYYYREAVRFDHGYQKLADNIANDEIREVAGAFVANIRRIESLHFLTPLTVFFSASIQAWILESQLKLVGNINEPVDPDSELAQKITAGVNAAKTAWLKQWQGRSNDLIQYLWERGNDQLDVFLQQYGPELFGSGVESLLTVLEGIRNVIAHSAGKIDHDFKNRATENSVAYGNLVDLPLKSALPVDGNMVREFLSLSISVCSAILPIAEKAIIGKNIPDGVEPKPA
jgi:hypothetical protein